MEENTPGGSEEKAPISLNKDEIKEQNAPSNEPGELTEHPVPNGHEPPEDAPGSASDKRGAAAQKEAGRQDRSGQGAAWQPNDASREPGVQQGYRNSPDNAYRPSYTSGSGAHRSQNSWQGTGYRPGYTTSARPRRTGRIVGLCILIGLLVAALIVGLGACGRIRWNFNWGWGSGNEDPFSLPVRQELSQDMAGIDVIDVSLSMEDLVLTEGSGDQLTVRQQASNSIADDELAVMRVDGGTLRIESRVQNHSTWFNFGPGPRLRLTISVPAGYEGLIEAECTSGEISAQGVPMEDLSLATSSGDILVDNVQCALLSMRSTSGDLDLRDVTSDDATMARSSGDLQAEGLVCRNLVCEASSGDTKLENVSCDSLKATATSGELELDVDVKDSCQLETSSGDIQLDGNAAAVAMQSTSGEQTANLLSPLSILATSSSGDKEISVQDAGDLETVECEATSGSVTLRLPEGTSVSLDHNASSGDLDLDSADGLTLSENGIHVSIRTSSGDARLESN